MLTVEWLDGEKLSQSHADDVGSLVNLGVICYLKQLLQTGFFHAGAQASMCMCVLQRRQSAPSSLACTEPLHQSFFSQTCDGSGGCIQRRVHDKWWRAKAEWHADPHPGNLIRTPDGRLAIIDFGLMTNIDDEIKYGMIEAISHLIHRDYEAIVADFVTLQFIPRGTNLQPILPVLANVFDQALEGGGAKNINFQELSADLAQITFDYPFRIPPCAPTSLTPCLLFLSSCKCPWCSMMSLPACVFQLCR